MPPTLMLPSGDSGTVAVTLEERWQRAAIVARAGRRLPPRGRRRRRLVLGGLLLAVLSPVFYSYVSTMVRPSSLPLGVRSVEWVRDHHGHWLVDEAERIYYGWLKAPERGGPQLRALPSLALPEIARVRSVRPRAVWPRPVASVFAHRLPGEGIWRGTGPIVDGRPPVLVTTVRTELAYPRLVAYVAWFDHTRTSLAWYPGRYEPPAASLRGPASVPFGQRWRLLATFNGGFTHVDGNNGSAIDGHTDEPLRDGLATLVGYRDGRVDIVKWGGGPTAGPAIAFARQSLPPIVWNGRLNPALNDSTAWGYTLGNAVRVWRTGVGIDRRGNVVYVAADYQTVRTLAEILRRVGAVRAMQFDINPEWPSLISYRHRRGIRPTKIVPNVQQSAWRYLVPDDRDFVAVYRRLPGEVTVPLK
ncbi:MAG TPA: phosphodiester glycosidase family protein [Gaiellaceae bacterium]|nr:phosphodiester glycosidase family protein [Gaiellaceae bacterium]